MTEKFSNAQLSTNTETQNTINISADLTSKNKKRTFFS